MSALHELPIKPSFTEDMVIRNYTEELKQVSSVSSLRKFLDRWNAVFRLNFPGNLCAEPLIKLGDKQYSDEELAEALDCIDQNRIDVCPHAEDNGCIGINIVMPPALISATVQAMKFQVASDLALIQMNGGTGEIDEF